MTEHYMTVDPGTCEKSQNGELESSELENSELGSLLANDAIVVLPPMRKKRTLPWANEEERADKRQEVCWANEEILPTIEGRLQTNGDPEATIHTDELGPDLDDGHTFDKRQKLININYKTRNLFAARVRRVALAKRIGYDLYRIQLRDWQAGIPWDLKEGHDVMCVVATGQGKTMVASIYSALFPHNFIVFISPLVALIEEQVSKFRRQSLTAISVTQKFLEENGDIWSDIANGKYQIVMCAPEVVSGLNGSFCRRVASTNTKFRLHCKLIVIDEAYLIWGW